MVYFKVTQNRLESIRKQLGDKEFINMLMDFLSDDMAEKIIEDAWDTYGIKPKVKK